MSNNTVTLKVNCHDYHGWKSVQITRSLQTIASYFQLEYTDRWAGQATPLPLFPGQECTVLVYDIPVITGYIDSINPWFDAASRTMSCAGRDKTADLVDCSAIHNPGEFRNLALDGIVRALVAPFHIDIKIDASVGEPFTVFKLQPSETVFEAIERAARLRGVLLITDGLGNLILTKPGQQRIDTCLVQGKNVLSADCECDFKERYSQYTVKGQQQGFDELLPKQCSQITARATDANVKRYRPLTILSEAQVNAGNAQTRANWEATVRAARSQVVNITVQGWLQNEKTRQLWEVNQRVSVKLPWLGIESELLITQVTFTLNASGSTTALQLMHPEAFIPQPQIPESTSINNWKKLINAS